MARVTIKVGQAGMAGSEQALPTEGAHAVRKVHRAVMFVASMLVVAGCGTSHAANSHSAPNTTLPSVATSFRGGSTFSLVTPVPVIVVRSKVYGNINDYVLTSRATGQLTETCFSSGGWRQQVSAAGGGTTTLDLTDPQYYQVLVSFLGERPGLAIGLADLHLPPTPVPATWHTTFSVPPSALVGLAERLAPQALRAGVRQATVASVRSARGPLLVTAWWSATQRDLPRRIRLVIKEHSGAGEETDVIAWEFKVPGPSVTHC